MGNMEQTTEVIGAETPASESLSNVIEAAVQCETLTFSLNVDVLKQFLSELSALVDEARIVFSVTDGLRARVVDPAHVAMVDTGIALEMLETFDWTPHSVTVQEDGYVAEIGIDVDKMTGYLKSLKLKDTELRFSVDFARRQMTVDGPTGQRVMSLIDTTGISDPKIPTLNLPTELEIRDPKAFRGQIRQAETISDHIAIRYDSAQNALYLECEGDMDKMRAQVDCETVQQLEHPRQRINTIGETEKYMTSDSRSLFPLEYLADFAKVIPVGFRLTIGDDYPLKIQYGRTVYLLAPRIESGD
jgi:DNA polymerase III sliding clamp (beta) subunit (PCNA family)